jgi:membrane protein YdbS with pleckstrin-like domain
MRLLVVVVAAVGVSLVVAPAGTIPAIGTGLLVAFVVFALLNPPARYRLHSWGQVRQASDHRRGVFGRRYTEDPVSDAPAREEIRRNDPCPCGSGRKYKRCCANRS